VSVEFEPVQLGPRRRRGVDPVAIGALLVVIGLAAAVAKPWDSGSTTATATRGPAAEPQPLPGAASSLDARGAAPTAATPGISTASAPPPLAWDQVRPVIHPHDAWGIRVIVNRPLSNEATGANQHLAELWYPIQIGATGIPTVNIDQNDRPVVGLGITFPADRLPLDTRIWRVQPDGLTWVDTRALDPTPSGGAFLYQPEAAGPLAGAWGAGTYRIDVLVDGSVQRFGLAIPNRFGIVPGFSELPLAPQGLVLPGLVPVSELGIGLFAMAGDVAVPLPAHEGPALTEAAAWLNVDPGTGRAPRSFVASAYLPRATGIGVMLPAGSLIKDATVGRLAPDSLVQAHPDVIVFGGPSQKSWAGFLAPGGGAWAPGVYRFTVAWSDTKGLHNGSWHVELRPGPVHDTPRPLWAVRAYARYAGASGVVLGTTNRLDGGSGIDLIRLMPVRPSTAPGFPVRDQVSCDGIRLDRFTGIVGVAYPRDAAPPSTVTVRALYEFSRSEEQPILMASGDVPGLILIALAGDVPLMSRAYRLRIGDDTTTPGVTVCLGTIPVY
jgi:hypothetical protein